jgi:hypothetical protein
MGHADNGRADQWLLERLRVHHILRQGQREEGSRCSTLGALWQHGDYWPETKSFFVCLKMNSFEIRPGKKITANVNIANVRLFIGNIPKNKTKEEIKEEFAKYVGELPTSMRLLCPFGCSIGDSVSRGSY